MDPTLEFIDHPLDDIGGTDGAPVLLGKGIEGQAVTAIVSDTLFSYQGAAGTVKVVPLVHPHFW